MRWVIGVDIGGTNLVVGAVAEDGSRILGAHTRPTEPARGPDAVINEIVAMVEHTREVLRFSEPGADVIGLGIGAPGPLDTRNGIVLLTPNLGWIDMPLRARLSEPLELPAALDNDANCAVLGECWIGAARDAHYVIGMTIGTGIGGGVIVADRLLRGAHGLATELGHLPVQLDGPLCSCGQPGHLEALASGTAIARRVQEQGGLAQPSAAGEATTEEIAAAARAGDPVAVSVLRAAAHALGTGLAGLVHTFNPELIILGGGVARAGGFFLQEVEAVLRSSLMDGAFAEGLELKPSTLGDEAALLGGLALVKTSS